MFGYFFTDAPNIQTEKDVQKGNISLFKRFFHAMLNEGIYFAPSAYEIGFISSAHRDKEINMTLKAADKVFKTLSG
ncbi:Glutamate-1-semialdehyde 2,1-aminomutase [compost metagenome]